MKAKKAKISSRKIPIIPIELEEEILQKFPVKSLVRFKSVSKRWRSTIESLGFIERHVIHEKSRTTPKILSLSSISETDASLTNLSVEDGEQIYRSYTLSHRFQPPLWFSGSCDGLVCFCDQTSIYVNNPATRELRQLPPANFQVRSGDPIPSVVMQQIARSLVGFGRDNVTGTYKVVLLYKNPHVLNNQVEDRDISTNCEVFALDTGVWRCIDPTPYQITLEKRSVFMDGSLFCFANLDHELWGHPKMIAFDLHEENFRVMPDLSFYGQYSSLDDLLQMFIKNDRLHVMNVRIDPRILEFWALEDEGWEKKVSINKRSEHTRPSQRTIMVTEHVKQKLHLSHFHICMLRRVPHLLCNVFCRDVMFYFESLVSVYP